LEPGLVIEAMQQTPTYSKPMESLRATYLLTATEYDGREDMGAIFRGFKSFNPQTGDAL
jgi:hypothetical protein